MNPNKMLNNESINEDWTTVCMVVQWVKIHTVMNKNTGN